MDSRGASKTKAVLICHVVPERSAGFAGKLQQSSDDTDTDSWRSDVEMQFMTVGMSVRDRHTFEIVIASSSKAE